MLLHVSYKHLISLSSPTMLIFKFQFLTNLDKKSGTKAGFLVNGFAGSLAGVTAVVLTFPLDTVRARLAFQIDGCHVYNGIVHTLATIIKTVSIIFLEINYCKAINYTFTIASFLFIARKIIDMPRKGMTTSDEPLFQKSPM